MRPREREEKLRHAIITSNTFLYICHAQNLSPKFNFSRKTKICPESMIVFRCSKVLVCEYKTLEGVTMAPECENVRLNWFCYDKRFGGASDSDAHLSDR